ncbi:Taurine import ATP-binding protein TauB [Hyella patelloides LEGE 07179]|uniref:Taurine import ATP-binding protein TauB n=1 Tax=Hyella patelloides LEGE 07179 TaxID=945734 RepID=A0A563W3Z3_9CYAN|nr:ATP-binding cassette domain-containing protein [Hyella patelloides]VEP18367.1 Taurine import ATP-binding protein TauB [Hyella patelloides LEGE 07179]
MLILDRIYYQYDLYPILDGVSLTLAPGQILCLTGPSGCGKTTVMRIAAGLIKPNSGVVNNRFAGTAYVFQEPRLLPWQTTQENIAFGLKAQGISPAKRDRYSQELAQQLGLEKALNHYPHQLSGGMQQRVALGRALAINPDLLLLDEPFKGLDIGRRREFQAMLLKLLSDRKLAACIISHDLAEAVRFGDRILVMSPSPSRIVHQWQSPQSPATRDEVYIYQEVSQLLALPQVSSCFHLNNIASHPNFMKSQSN